MSWERRGQNLYYTRSLRQNGRVIREYVGKDRLAKLAAEQDFHKREVQVQLSADIREIISQLRYSEHLLRKVCQQIRIAVDNAMAARGFFQHARSTWRKSLRSRTMTTIQDEATDTEDDFLDDPLLQIFPEDIVNEPNVPAGSDEKMSQASGPADLPSPDSDNVNSSRKLPDDLFLVRQAKVALFRVLGIAADSRTVFEADLTVIWNQITLPGDPPAVLMLAEQYLLEWLRYHVCVIKQNNTTASNHHIRLIETFQKGANSESQQLMNMAKQIITIRKMLATESQTPSPKKTASPKQSSNSQPKFRKPMKTEVPKHHLPV